LAGAQASEGNQVKESVEPKNCSLYADATEKEPDSEGNQVKASEEPVVS
jgi:hypothetical protein